MGSMIYGAVVGLVGGLAGHVSVNISRKPLGYSLSRWGVLISGALSGILLGGAAIFTILNILRYTIYAIFDMLPPGGNAQGLPLTAALLLIAHADLHRGRQVALCAPGAADQPGDADGAAGAVRRDARLSVLPGHGAGPADPAYRPDRPALWPGRADRRAAHRRRRRRAGPWRGLEHLDDHGLPCVALAASSCPLSPASSPG